MVMVMVYVPALKTCSQYENHDLKQTDWLVTTNSVTYADYNRLLRNPLLRTIHDYLMGFQQIVRRSSGLLHTHSVCVESNRHISLQGLATVRFRCSSLYPLLCPRLKSVLEIGYHLRHLSLGNLPCSATNAATTPNYCFTNYMLSCLICSFNRILQDEDLQDMLWRPRIINQLYRCQQL